MHGLAVFVKDGFPIPNDLSLKNFEDLYFCFQMALVHLMQ